MLNVIWNYGFTALCIELQLNSCKVVNKPRIPGICYNNLKKISVIDIIFKLNVFIGHDSNYGKYYSKYSSKFGNKFNNHAGIKNQRTFSFEYVELTPEMARLVRVCFTACLFGFQ